EHSRHRGLGGSTHAPYLTLCVPYGFGALVARAECEVGVSVGCLANKYSGGNHRGPEALLIANGCLRDVLRPDDLIGQPIDFLLLIPALVRVDLESEGRRQHFRGELLRVVSGDVFALAE